MHSSTSGAIAPKKPGLLINRDFALLWTGGAISVFGDIIFDFTLTVWVALGLAAHQSWGPLAVSGVLLAASVPLFVFGPIAGVFVDRWDKRRTMLAMDAIRAVLIGLLVLATNIIPLPFLPDGRVPLEWQLGMVYGVVFLNTLCSQFFGPARFALIGDVVPEPQRAHAMGISHAAQMIAMIIAPPLAPVLYLALGAQWAIGIDALSFLGSFLLVLAVRAPKSATSRVAGQKPNFLREFFAGLGFVARNRVTSTLVISVVVIMLGASAFNALEIYFALNNLHVTPYLYGFLSTSQGVGAVLGAVIAGALAQRIGLARMVGMSLLLTSVCILVYARMTSFAPALALAAFGGVFQAALNVAVGPLILRVTPRAFVGRVMATINPTTGLAQILGTILAGYLASKVLPDFHQQVLGMQFGTFDTILTGGALLCIAGSIFTIARLGFRDPAPVEPSQAESAATPDAEPTVLTEAVPAE